MTVTFNRTPPAMARGVAFRDAQEAWFWTTAALCARRDGARGARAGLERPCEPDDIVRCLDSLHHARSLGAPHLRVLYRWGPMGMSPDPRRDGDRHDWQLWREALARLEPDLIRRGIVENVAK